jgi:hypothetical protein
VAGDHARPQEIDDQEYVGWRPSVSAGPPPWTRVYAARTTGDVHWRAVGGLTWPRIPEKVALDIGRPEAVTLRRRATVGKEMATAGG